MGLYEVHIDGELDGLMEVEELESCQVEELVQDLVNNNRSIDIDDIVRYITEKGYTVERVFIASLSVDRIKRKVCIYE